MKKAIVVMVALAALLAMQSVASASIIRSTGHTVAHATAGTLSRVRAYGINTHGGLWED